MSYELHTNEYKMRKSRLIKIPANVQLKMKQNAYSKCIENLCRICRFVFDNISSHLYFANMVCVCVCFLFISIENKQQTRKQREREQNEVIWCSMSQYLICFMCIAESNRYHPYVINFRCICKMVPFCGLCSFSTFLSYLSSYLNSAWIPTIKAFK